MMSLILGAQIMRITGRCPNVVGPCFGGRLWHGAAITFMARAGLELYGLDPSAGTLSVVRDRDGGDLASWYEGTIEQFGEDGLFEMIFMTVHAFQCLLQDNEIISFFKRCARLLSESGI